MAKDKPKKKSKEAEEREKQLHELLRSRRLAANLTLDEAAKSLGFSAPYLSRLEREIPALTMTQCDKFALVYGLDFKLLMKLSGHLDDREQYVPAQAINAAFEFVVNDPTRVGVLPSLQTLQAKAMVVVYWQARASRRILRSNEQMAVLRWAKTLTEFTNTFWVGEQRHVDVHLEMVFADEDLTDEARDEIKRLSPIMRSWEFRRWAGEGAIIDAGEEQYRTYVVDNEASNIVSPTTKYLIEKETVNKVFEAFAQGNFRDIVTEYIDQQA